MTRKAVRAVFPYAAGYGGTVPYSGNRVPVQGIFSYFSPLAVPPLPFGGQGLFLSVIPVRSSPAVR